MGSSAGPTTGRSAPARFVAWRRRVALCKLLLEHPDLLLLDAPRPPPVEATSKAQGLPEPWVEVTDEKTGKIYYGNTKTGETQFARPE